MGYEELSRDELRDAASARELSTSGTKADLIERLEADDAGTPDGATAEPDEGTDDTTTEPEETDDEEQDAEPWEVALVETLRMLGGFVVFREETERQRFDALLNTIATNEAPEEDAE